VNSEQEFGAAPQPAGLGPTKVSRGDDRPSSFSLPAVESQVNDGLFSTSFRFSTSP